MSVLIKGMDMPDNCEECKIKLWDEGENDYVCPFSGVMTLSIGRQNDCPLEEQEPCEDAVSREEVLNGAITHYSVSGANIAYRNAVPIEHIQNLPSVTPKIPECDDAVSRDRMGRAIDADKLCTDLIERWDIADKQKEELIRQVMANIVTPIVVSQPTIEPEIIRCKDCRYADEDGVCQNSKGLAIQDDYDFCSYAERRTDGEAVSE